MKSGYHFDATIDNNGNSSVSIKHSTTYHTFNVLGRIIYATVNNSDVLVISNMVAMVNTLGSTYWNNFLLQNLIPGTDFPYEIYNCINENIAQWTRDLKIRSIVE